MQTSQSPLCILSLALCRLNQKAKLSDICFSDFVVERPSHPSWLSKMRPLKILIRLCESDITKTYLYNCDPLTPHFYIIKLGFTGVYTIFLTSTQKQRLWCSLEPPRRGGSNEYPQSMHWAEIRKISEFFMWKLSAFGGEILIYLDVRVFVMDFLLPYGCSLSGFFSITKTRLFKYIENFLQKLKKIQIKNSDIFHISAQNIDCGYSLEPPRRGGSNEYPQSMFFSRNKKKNVYPCKPQFFLYKRGVEWGQNYIGMFSWCMFCPVHCHCCV